ncbi:MAG: GH92 family glycosyl hydrolase, partial [Bacteroidales bacterium]|nr:GH92 family glycosyl hydrolase [Bacteroidales bacterium]
SEFYKNLYDKETGFMRPRDDERNWEDDFDPMRVGFSFTEGNSFQYSLFVPHDVEGLKELIGGEKAFENWLDKLFSTEIEKDLGDDSDVTGLIGNYAHGNEPSHHLAFLYNYTQSPWKTQKRTHQILTDLYQDNPGGICGNEDCGQMSAWYVMSAMGLYPVCPGAGTYALSTPVFEKITLKLENDKSFVISAPKSHKGDIYIKDLKLNGKSYRANYIDHKTIIESGELNYTLTSHPEEAMTFELSDQQRKDKSVSIPYVKEAQRNFIEHTYIDLHCDTPEVEIYYTLDGTELDKSSILYSKAFGISASCLVKAKAFKHGYSSSVVFEKDFVKSKPIQKKNFTPGLSYRVYNGIYRSVYDWQNDVPVRSGIYPHFSLDCRDRDQWYGLTFSGYIYIPFDDEYTFSVLANDGCQMKINSEELFESDGRKSHSLMQRYKLALKAGYHQVELSYYQCSDTNELSVYWESNRITKAIIPDNNLFH